MLGNKDAMSGETVRCRIMRYMAALDLVILRLPEDPPDSMVDELDRIITTLRTAEQSAMGGTKQGALGLLDLAGARIERFAKVVEEYEPPETE